MPPTPTPSHLVASIAQLQEDFQRIADWHDWICLSTPLPSSQQVWLSFAGERILGPNGGLNLATIETPRSASRRSVADHVGGLTNRAEALLEKVLEYDSHIPTDVQEELREEKRGFGHGWVRWLRYTTTSRHRCWVEHYAQAAASALRMLKDYCLLAEELNPSETPKKLRNLAEKIQSRITDLPVGKLREKVSDPWRWCIESLWDEGRLIPVQEGRSLPDQPSLKTITSVRAAFGLLLDWANAQITWESNTSQVLPPHSKLTRKRRRRPTDDNPPKAQHCPANSTAILSRIPDQASVAEIAKCLGYPELKKSLNTCLGRYRNKHKDCAAVVQNKRSKEATYMYRAPEIVLELVKWLVRVRTK